MRRSALALVVAANAAVPALANDSSAELTTGGLIFVRNDDVEMRAEDLRISAKEVHVGYRFFNKSDQPVTVLVAFPMPEIKLDGPDHNVSVPTEDPVNLLAFTTTVNGRPVDTKVEQRVLAAGLDRTALLKAETVIEHRYQPSVGASVQTSLGAPGAAQEAWHESYKSTYCMDRQLLATLDRARAAAKSETGAPFSEERIEYILKTGANWSGPIKEFRLVVDKGDADSLVSFCGEGVRKISDTQFEMRKSDYTPEGNLAILILKKLKPQ